MISHLHSSPRGKKIVSMRRILPFISTVFLLAALMSLCACAMADKRMEKQTFTIDEPIKVCRYETPGIMKSTGTETALLSAITIAAPGGTALLILGDEYAKARGSDTQGRIPDFGSLVMNKFAGYLRTARPEWTNVTVVQEPLKDKFCEKCAVIEFTVNRVAYGSLDLTRGGIVLERGIDKGVVTNGFLSKTLVSMQDPQGEVIWQKSYLYLSDNFNRSRTYDELEADDLKLLKEEMEFAAEKTALDFIDHLNGVGSAGQAL